MGDNNYNYRIVHAPPAEDHSMTIAFECTACKSRLNAKPKLAGRTLACPKCSEQLTVPQPKSLEGQPLPISTDASPLATEKQKAFATELGIEFPEGIDRRMISKMIDEALVKQEDARFERLNLLRDGEDRVRDELRNEIMGECDEEDPRVSVATTEQILDALAKRDIGVILITFEYGILSGVEDLTGEKFSLSSTDDLDEHDLKTIVSWLGLVMLRR